MKKNINILFTISFLFLTSCSYMPKWLTDLTSSEQGSELENEAVQPDVVYYDTQSGSGDVEQGEIKNDLNAIFFDDTTSNTPSVVGNLTPQDIVQVPTRENINPGIAPDTIPNNDTVYFAFDSSSMPPEVKNKVNSHIDFLIKNPGIRVVLEGHADERGSREYNLGLGELRALAVKDLMVLKGVKSDQVFVISYGEEKPADPANNESAWAKNRRVEVIYR